MGGFLALGRQLSPRPVAKSPHLAVISVSCVDICTCPAVYPQEAEKQGEVSTAACAAVSSCSDLSRHYFSSVVLGLAHTHGTAWGRPCFWSMLALVIHKHTFQNLGTFLFNVFTICSYTLIVNMGTFQSSRFIPLLSFYFFAILKVLSVIRSLIFKLLPNLPEVC